MESWRPGDVWRFLEPGELALLEELIALDFEGAAALSAQVAFTTAQQGCGCGCGTLNLRVDERRVPAAMTGDERSIVVEADVRSPSGEWDGGLILFVRGGYLRCLEIYTWRDEPMQLPQVSDIRAYVPGRPMPSTSQRDDHRSGPTLC